MGTKENFRANLSYYMKQANMNQIELANAVGKSEGSVSFWLAGKAFPRIDTIQKIADVLGCATDDLLADNQSHRPTLGFMNMSRPIDPSIIDRLIERTRTQTPKEDAQMALLWGSASIQAKRAAIAVLESMKEVKFK